MFGFAAKKPRAPYGSKKAAREAAAAAAAVAAKLAVPSRESRRRMSSMKAQAIIADALAEAEVEITDAALPGAAHQEGYCLATLTRVDRCLSSLVVKCQRFRQTSSFLSVLDVDVWCVLFINVYAVVLFH